MADNLGKISRFSNQESRPDLPLTPKSRVSAVGRESSLAQSAQDARRSNERASSELPLNPTLLDEHDWSHDDESSMRMVGYAALGVTFLVFVVLLSPWLGPVVRGWFR